jgi:hypothetical protein
MVGRWSIYLWETFQPLSRLLASLFITLLSFAIIKQRYFIELNPLPFIAVFLTYFLMILYYRLSDEFKDYETDLKYFPDRPVPSGRVSLKDLGILRWITVALTFALQAFMPHAFREFFVFMLFSWLMSVWFFLPKLISTNRLLAFVTHMPVGFIGSYYAFKSLYPEMETSDPYLLLGIVTINIPALIWEILRKTRTPSAEQAGYQTYSQMLGFNGALLVGALLLILCSYLTYLLMQEMNAGWITIGLNVLVHLLFTILLVVAAFRKNKSFDLKHLGEAHSVCFYLLFLFDYLLAYPWS